MYDISFLNTISRVRTLHYRRDLDEVLQLARATPALAKYLPEMGDVINWFDRALSNESNNREELNGYWFDFVNMVLQRYAVIFDVELSAADKLVANFFQRFLYNPVLKNHVRLSYRDNVTPLVFLGRGGPRVYYTLPPSVHRPLAFIHLPRAALNNVWRWTVLAHETGHDVFFCIDNLARDLNLLVSSVVTDALLSGLVTYTPVHASFKVNNSPVVMEKTPEQFAVSLWVSWINEIFADLFALLMCGPSTVVSMQDMIGFSHVGLWHGVQGPDSHPVPLIRNLMNLSVLRQLGFTNEAKTLEGRLIAHGPVAGELVWLQGGRVEVARAGLDNTLALANKVTDAMLHVPLPSLNNHALRDIINFDHRDQAIVYALVDFLANGYSAPGEYEPRHLAAAAQLAFNTQPYHAEKIHSKVLQLLSN